MNKPRISNKGFWLKAIAIVVLQGFLLSNIVTSAGTYDLKSLWTNSSLRIQSAVGRDFIQLRDKAPALSMSTVNKRGSRIASVRFHQWGKFAVLAFTFLFLANPFSLFAKEKAKPYETHHRVVVETVIKPSVLAFNTLSSLFGKGEIKYSRQPSVISEEAQIPKKDKSQTLAKVPLKRALLKEDSYSQVYRNMAGPSLDFDKDITISEPYTPEFGIIRWRLINKDTGSEQIYWKDRLYTVTIKDASGRMYARKGKTGLEVIRLHLAEIAGELQVIDIYEEDMTLLDKILIDDANIAFMALITMFFSPLLAFFLVPSHTGISNYGYNRWTASRTRKYHKETRRASKYKETARKRKLRAQRISQQIADAIEVRANREIDALYDKEKHIYDNKSTAEAIKALRKKYYLDYDRLERVRKKGFFYSQYRSQQKENFFLRFLPPFIIIALVARDLYFGFIDKTPVSLRTDDSNSFSRGGGSSFTSSGGGTITYVDNRELLSKDDPLSTLIESAKATVRENRKPSLLEKSNPEANLQEKLNAMTDSMHISADDSSELKDLIGRYFELERLVHRIKKRYVSTGRINLLAKSGWTVFSHSLLKQILNPLVYSDSAVSGADEIDFMSVYGEGRGGLQTDIDEFFGSGELVSLTLESFNNLDSVHGTGFEDTGIAIVYSKKLENAAPMMAVNAPDLDHLSLEAMMYVKEAQAEELKKEVFTVNGIRKLRQETVLRQGMKGNFRYFGELSRQDSFGPREVMKADGILGEYIEMIVVADDLFNLVQNKAGWKMKDKVVRASDYFGNNERLNEAKEIKKEILEILDMAKKKVAHNEQFEGSPQIVDAVFEAVSAEYPAHLQIRSVVTNTLDALEALQKSAKPPIPQRLPQPISNSL